MIIHTRRIRLPPERLLHLMRWILKGVFTPYVDLRYTHKFEQVPFLKYIGVLTYKNITQHT